jgi:hypothetical protein
VVVHLQDRIIDKVMVRRLGASAVIGPAATACSWPGVTTGLMSVPPLGRTLIAARDR